jgi:predicted esterase
MRYFTILAVLLGSPAPADEPDRFAGDWKTTLGPVHLDVKGATASGGLVTQGLPLKGTIEGRAMKLGFEEGGVHVDAALELEVSGNAFRGTFVAANGNRGTWNGWRPDPGAGKGTTANFAGSWLTDLGLMELSQQGDRVEGHYALRGTSRLEGTAKGRHLEFRVQAFRKGPGWFDLDDRGMLLAGAGGTDGIFGWYGWKGRKAPEFPRHSPLVAGKIVEGSTTGLLTYCARAPESFRPGDPRKWPAIVILHGSNMNAKDYVATIAAAWPDLARDFLILGINGELPSSLDRDRPTFNYTYINFTGRSTFGGFPGTDRESPALVREALEELRGVYPIRSYLVGGHSQGGFLTYSLLMNSPELVAGAFPISAGLIFQCEPSAYRDEPIRSAQRAVPLAIVHGRNDPLVGFDGASYAHGLFLDAGWPAVRLFDDTAAGHMFARLPVDRAIRWLETMASEDPARLLDLAERRIGEHAYRDAIAAVRRARTSTLDAPAKGRLAKLLAAIDAEASPRAATFLRAIRANKDGTWIDDFLAYREQFQLAEPAAEVMAAFESLRSTQRAPAEALLGEARGLFQQGRRDDARKRLEEIVKRYYASPSYRPARTWLSELN